VQVARQSTRKKYNLPRFKRLENREEDLETGAGGKFDEFEEKSSYGKDFTKPDYNVIDPSVAPRFDVVPVTVMVGSPIRVRGSREPDGAVIRRGTPIAILIEILVANDICRNVMSRPGTLPAAIATGRPSLKLILTAGILAGCMELIRSGETVGITRTNGVGSISTTGDFSLAVACG
jgi:hypothetical protein